ncbi:GAF domain-containing protein [Chloroflexus sp. MS-CIW-1]|jgi:PAS domain S-box-containing protein|uniref:GAF domain-containing protein n=1 Tax=unclassified Chloroflexus TaxID=2633855 RepID=UPI0004DFBCCC|nr:MULTISPECIES: GAF domain-containing protein [unclassified Chloroflexus]MBO9348285.1 GAF domain-containing protein [Chloroflexus sp.]MDN5272684.1 GAF domain-containing protein [Chloroflexus sp. MS-CIW-1]
MSDPESSLAQSAMNTQGLLRIATAIETAATLDELLMLTLNEFVQGLGVSLCGVLLLDPAGETISLVSTFPPRISLPPPIPLRDLPLIQQAFQQRQPYQILDLTTMPQPGDRSPVVLQLLGMLNEAQVRSLLVIPLVAQDTVIGALAFATLGQIRHFDDQEISVARLMASQLAAAITSFRMIEEASRREAELATLNDIAAAVTSSLDPREIYHLVMEKINQFFRVDAGSLLMLDDETGELVFVMTLEEGQEKLVGLRVPAGAGIVGDVARTQQYAIVHDAESDPRFYRAVSDGIGYNVHSILCVPIVVKGRTIGVIELLNKRTGHFTEEEAIRLTRMAATIGIAIENARLFQQVSTVRDRFEAIVNSTNDGILMADMRGVVVASNPAAAQIFHRSRESLIGCQLDELIDELMSRALVVEEPTWLNEGASHRVIEIELNDGPVRYVRHTTLPVLDTANMQIGRLALFEDIAKDRELARLREDYTGMLIHDLRAPLTAIMNGIMMMLRGLGGPVSEQQRELLGIAYQGSQTMLEMVNTLLDISKMEQGRMNLNLEPLSPYALVDEAIERLRASIQQRRINLVQNLAISLPPIEADRDKIVRVLQNLIDNAVKFSPERGMVTIGGRYLALASHVAGDVHPDLPFALPEMEAGEWLIYWVRDEGPGIPPQYHARIFEKFGQVQQQKSRGTGLGLTFCKLAVEAHKGKIWLQSREGLGSTFAFALPVRQRSS